MIFSADKVYLFSIILRIKNSVTKVVSMLFYLIGGSKKKILQKLAEWQVYKCLDDDTTAFL